ncbi:auxin efflux carrier [Trametes gibbosa]|nr:auxin efflux carrier [Trametes gibbosa]
MAVSTGLLIYLGVMPLIKTYVHLFVALICGYVLVKIGMFPPAASRGLSIISINIALPALIFANIVPSFTLANISALGPVILIASIYMFSEFAMGMIIREVCYVPRNFWQGIVIMTGMSNWGNLLGVSYVSIFTVCYHICFWVGGGAHSLSWDYLPGVPQGEEAERHVSWKEKPIGRIVARYILRLPMTPPLPPAINYIKRDEEDAYSEKECKVSIETFEVPATDLPKVIISEEPQSDPQSDSDIQLTRRTSRISAVSSFRSQRLPGSVPPSPLRVTMPSSPLWVTIPASSLKISNPPLAALLKPVTIAIAISLPVALIKPLKALFVDMSSLGGPNWHGPDGRPPLVFVMDTAQFINTVAVPLALILLGASFVRIKVPRPIMRLPIMAMLLVTMAKMVVQPVMGVFIVQVMVHKGLIPSGAKAEQFVAMLLSGTPAAVNQIIVSSLHAPDGNVDTMSAFFLVQFLCKWLSSAPLELEARLGEGERFRRGVQGVKQEIEAGALP